MPHVVVAGGDCIRFTGGATSFDVARAASKLWPIPDADFLDWIEGRRPLESFPEAPPQRVVAAPIDDEGRFLDLMAEALKRGYDAHISRNTLLQARKGGAAMTNDQLLDEIRDAIQHARGKAVVEPQMVAKESPAARRAREAKAAKRSKP